MTYLKAVRVFACVQLNYIFERMWFPVVFAAILLFFCWCQNTDGLRIGRQFGQRLSATRIKRTSRMDTGTTIVGICCSNGVVFGGDTRSSSGPMIMDNSKNKVRKVAENIYCGGSGTSADCEQICRRVNHVLSLEHLERGDKFAFASVKSAIVTLVDCYYPGDFQSGTRTPECSFLLGGVDPYRGPQLYAFDTLAGPRSVSYSAIGSGSYNAMCSLEANCVSWGNGPDHLSGGRGSHQCDCYGLPPSEFDGGMGTVGTAPISITEGLVAVRAAVRMGILNDLASGSNIDLAVIYLNGTSNCWREDI